MISDKGDLGTDFAGTVAYLRHGKNRQTPDRADWITTRNLPRDPEHAADVMQRSSGLGRTEKPLYHRWISASPGETLSREQMEAVADRVLQALELTEHQVVLAQHTDNGKQHVHLVVNRVHPGTNRVWNARHDYAKVERALRGLERELGLRQVRGRHWAEPGQHRYRGPSPAKDHARPFADRARSLARPALEGATSWQELHASLVRHGLTLQPDRRNRGLVVTDGNSFVKASTVSRKVTRPRLERRLGPFEPASQDLGRLLEVSRGLATHRRLDRAVAAKREILFQRPTAQRRRLAERALERLGHLGEALPAQGLLRRQGAVLVRSVGWKAAGRLLPVPHFQALRIAVTLTRGAARGGQELGR